MWFGNSLIRIGLCCNSEMQAWLDGWGVLVSLHRLCSSLVFTSISVKVVKWSLTRYLAYLPTYLPT